MDRIVKRYCIKCAVIFMIILAVCVPVASAAYQIIETQVIDTAGLRLKEGVSQMDYHLEQMVQMTQNVKQDQNFKILNRVKGELPPEQYLALSGFNDYLKNMKISSSFSPFLFSMFQNNDAFVSSAQCSGSFTDTYYGVLLEIKENGRICTAQEVKERILNQKPFYSFWVTDQVSFWAESGMRKVERAILCSILGNGTNSLKDSYVMTFLIDPDEMVEEILMGQMGEEGIVQISDSSGQVLISRGDSGSLPVSMERGTLHTTSGNYQILSDRAGETGWMVQIGVPQAFITGQVKGLIRLVIVYAGIGAALLVAAVLLLVYRQFSSVKKLLLLCPADQKEWKRNRNEYEILASVLTEMKEHTDQFREDLERIKQQNQTIITENFIVRGIAGENDKKILREMWNPFPEFYCMAVMRTRGEEDICQMAALFMEKALVETLKKRVIPVHIGAEEEVFLLEMKVQEEPSIKPVVDQLERISRLLLHEQGIVTHIGVSTIATRMENVSNCYKQARQILMAHNQDNQRIVEGYCSDWKLLGNQLTGLEWLQKLAVLLSCGEREQVHSLIEKWKKECRKSPLAFEHQKMQIFFSIRNAICDTCEQTGISVGDEELPVYQGEDTPEKMAGKLIQASDLVMNRLDEKKKSRNHQLKARILSYLEEHFEEEGLTAFRICDQIGISEKYLIQFVKEQTGESFTVFLERKRIEKAMDYLKTTDFSNEVIAAKCGFSAVNTFYRVFRKRVGMSPGAYRRECIDSYHLEEKKQK